MDNLKIYNALKQPPKEALRQIQGGRLSGKTDINPQWRYRAMTEQFGMCGVGWKFETTGVWYVPAGDGQLIAFATINLYVKQGDSWSDPIPGLGGSMLVEKEKAGLHANDEGYKMAITDALSTAMKMLGVAADIYAGLWDGAKYRDAVESTATAVKDAPVSTTAETPKSTEPEGDITQPQMRKMMALAKEKGVTEEKLHAHIYKNYQKRSRKSLTKEEAGKVIDKLESLPVKDSPLVKAAKEMGAEEV